MIGLRIGPCVLDIVKGRVDLKRVDRIVTATQCRHEGTWLWTVQGCKRVHWQDCANEAEQVFLTLLREGRIVQPALDRTNPRVPIVANEIYWVESEDQITWKPAREA